MAMKHVLLTGCISMAAAQAAAIEYRSTLVHEPTHLSGYSMGHASSFGGLLGVVRPPLSPRELPALWNAGTGIEVLSWPADKSGFILDELVEDTFLIQEYGGTGLGGPVVYDRRTNIREEVTLPSIQDSSFEVLASLDRNRFVGYMVTQFANFFYEWQRTDGVWSYRRVDGFNGRPLGYSNNGMLYGSILSNPGTIPVSWDANQNRTEFTRPAGFNNGKMAGRLPDGRYLGMLVDNQNRHALGFWSSPTSVPTVLYTGALPAFQRDQFARESGAFMFGMGSVPYLWTPEDGVRTVASIVQAAIPGTTSFQVYDMDAYGRFAVLSLNTGKMHYIEPVPEPATLTSLGLGALALLRMRHQRQAK